MDLPVRLRLAAVAAAVTASLIVAGGPAHAIAHGTAVPDGQFAFAVKLSDFGIPVADGGRRNSSCSGGLIAPHWVLTAGHCFRDARGARVSRPVAQRTVATVGRADLAGHTGHEATVIGVRQSTTADVALAEIDTAVTDVRPLRISRAKPHVGEVVRLTGFGQLKATGSALPQRLQTGQFTVSSVAALVVGMVGTQPKPDTSPCPHDSGGPYFTQGADGGATVVGVVSHGPDCPHTGPDTAARVDAVAGWIQSVIGPDLAASPPSSAPPSAARPAPPALTAAPPAERRPAPPYWLLAPAAVLLGGLLLAALRRRTGQHRGAHRGRTGVPKQRVR